MAYIHLQSGRYIKVTPEQGNRIWGILNGETVPTEAETEKLRMVDRVILNRKNPSTPLSYLVEHPEQVEEPESFAGVMGMRRA